MTARAVPAPPIADRSPIFNRGFTLVKSGHTLMWGGARPARGCGRVLGGDRGDAAGRVDPARDGTRGPFHRICGGGNLRPGVGR